MDFLTDYEFLNNKWNSLTISDSFIFYKVMRDYPDLCLELLQRILPDLDIREIEFLDTEKSIEEGKDIRGVRFDAFAGDDRKRVYDVEMQAYNKDDIRKRSRYNQSMIDMELLDKGALFGDLKESYVIFICGFDIFEKGRHIYTFQNVCTEDHEIILDDKTTKIFLNAMGFLKDISSELKAFLDMMLGITSDDPFVKKVENAVAKTKLNREARRSYMTWEMELRAREAYVAKEVEERVREEDRVKIEEERSRADRAEMRVRELEAELSALTNK